MIPAVGDLESIIIELDDPNWNIWTERLADFQARAQIGHYRQSVTFSIAVADAGSPLYVVSCLSSGEIVASLLVRRLRTGVHGLLRLSVDRRPCLLSIEYLASYLEALKFGLKNSGDWLRLNPHICGKRAGSADRVLRQSGFAPAHGSAGEYEATLSIDLSRSEGEQWCDFRVSVRRQIRRAAKLGFEVFYDDVGDSAEDFFARCHIAARDKGFGIPGGVDALNVFCAWKAIQAKPILFMSRYEGRYVAGVTLMPAGNRVIYGWEFSGLEPRDRKLPYSHRLHREAKCWARKSGLVCYDMGGLWVNRGDQDPIKRFKLGFSPEIQPVPGEYFFPPAPILGRLTEAASTVRRWNVPGGVHE